MHFFGRVITINIWVVTGLPLVRWTFKTVLYIQRHCKGPLRVFTLTAQDQRILDLKHARCIFFLGSSYPGQIFRPCNFLNEIRSNNSEFTQFRFLYSNKDNFSFFFFIHVVIFPKFRNFSNRNHDCKIFLIFNKFKRLRLLLDSLAWTFDI